MHIALLYLSYVVTIWIILMLLNLTSGSKTMQAEFQNGMSLSTQLVKCPGKLSVLRLFCYALVIAFFVTPMPSAINNNNNQQTSDNEQTSEPFVFEPRAQTCSSSNQILGDSFPQSKINNYDESPGCSLESNTCAQAQPDTYKKKLQIINA